MGRIIAASMIDFAKRERQSERVQEKDSQIILGTFNHNNLAFPVTWNCLSSKLPYFHRFKQPSHSRFSLPPVRLQKQPTHKEEGRCRQ